MAVVISGSPSSEKKHERRRSGGMSMKIAAVAACLALGIGGTFLFLGIRDYNAMMDSRDSWAEISMIASGSKTGNSGTANIPEGFVEVPLDFEPDPGYDFSAESFQAVYKQDDYLYKAIDLLAIQAMNPYVSGYIYIPGTPIDYPVMKEITPGEYFYIDHNIYNRHDKYGSIFELCDEERGPDSPITWIFGHHMSSGSMFSGLYNFLEPEFVNTNVYLYRDGYRSEYKPFGACIVDMHDDAYAFGSYKPSSAEYTALLQRLKSMNRLPANGVEWPGADSEILILSTCYGGSGTRERMILLCIEQRRAVAPDYYRTLQEAQEYGGSQDAVNADTVPGYQDVERNENLSGVPDYVGNGG